MDLRPSLDLVFNAFGLPATVTVPGGSPTTATVVWITLQTVDAPAGAAVQVAEVQRVLALRRSEVPSLPRGSTIVAAERLGGTAKTWRVDGFVDAGADSEHLRVIVIPVA